MYTNGGRLTNNINTLLGNTNVTTYFQSFFNVALATYREDIHKDTKGWLTWDKRDNYGYDLISGNMFNNKYVITGIDLSEVKLSSTYYNLLDTYNECKYYQFKYDLPFFIYDELVTYNDADSRMNSTIFHRDFTLLKYGYIHLPDENTEDNYSKDDLKQLEDKKRLEDSGITFINTND